MGLMVGVVTLTSFISIRRRRRAVALPLFLHPKSSENGAQVLAHGFVQAQDPRLHVDVDPDHLVSQARRNAALNSGSISQHAGGQAHLGARGGAPKSCRVGGEQAAIGVEVRGELGNN